VGLGGALTNWDVYNYCALGDAYAFSWTLGDVTVADVDTTYVGEHDFADGAVGGTPEPSVRGDPDSDALIRWENAETPVPVGEKAHFGYDVHDAVTDDPSSIRSVWSLVGGEQCEIPKAILSWQDEPSADAWRSDRPGQEGRRFSATITNLSGETLLVQRSVKNLTQPGFALADLTAASSVMEDVQLLDPAPVSLESQALVKHYFDEAEGDEGLLFVYAVTRSGDGAPLFTAYHAIELPQPMPPATDTPTTTPTNTPEPTEEHVVYAPSLLKHLP
jgi:hypothetical protein